MKNKAPAFMFYASDYLADENVQLMSLEEEGAYARLLAYCWREGTLPASPESLAKLCKGCSTDVINVVQRLFQPSPDNPARLVHKRLEEERAKQEEHREQRSQAGKRFAEMRSKVSKPQQALERPLAQALHENPTFQSSLSTSISASELARETDGNSERLEADDSASPSINKKVGVAPAGTEAVLDIVHEIYRHYPVKLHDEKALAAIQTAMTVVDGETLLAAVKAYAAEIVRTNTEHPTWAEKWFTKQMWKSYLPVEAKPAQATPESVASDDQNLSQFSPEFYANLK